MIVAILVADDAQLAEDLLAGVSSDELFAFQGAVFSSHLDVLANHFALFRQALLVNRGEFQPLA